VMRLLPMILLWLMSLGPAMAETFALRPEALDEGRYTRFEAFLAESGLVEGMRPVSQIAVDLGAE